MFEYEILGFGVLIGEFEHHSPDEDLAAGVDFSFTSSEARADAAACPEPNRGLDEPEGERGEQKGLKTASGSPSRRFESLSEGKGAVGRDGRF